MPAELSSGHTWRRSTLADAAAIQAFVAEYSIAIIGYSDCTLDDIRDQLTEPGLTIDADTWLVRSSDGSLVAFAWTHPRGTGEYIDLEVITPHPELRDWLYDQTIARASELVAAGGHAQATLDIGIYRADEPAGEAAAAHGFRRATTFYRMRVDHDPDAPPTPIAPEDVTLRSGPGDEDFRRTAHEVLTTSFKDHFGWVPETFEKWHATIELSSTFDWSQITVAYLDSEPVGILVTSDGFVETDNCGKVDDLGILPAARGRGIAKYLLHTAFAADIKAGRVGTILHVDSNNTTPALGLYESVGMRPVLVIDKWCRTI